MHKPAEIIQEVAQTQSAAKDAPVEGLLVSLSSDVDLPNLDTLCTALLGAVPLIVVNDLREDPSADLPTAQPTYPSLLWHAANLPEETASVARFLAHCEEAGHHPALSLSPNEPDPSLVVLLQNSSIPPVISLRPKSGQNPVGEHRQLIAHLSDENLGLPLWIRNSDTTSLYPKDNFFSAQLLDTSILSGSLLCDGVGDLISVEHTGSLNRNRALAYNTLQGARARISKTEFVACPSCGRTLFDLQSTTHKIKEATGHLKGVTIAVMGCIVNGPEKWPMQTLGVGSVLAKLTSKTGEFSYSPNRCC